ncbi:MAG: DUF4367 domain-containing protein, partial [Peptococcaceae bacterium]|nr:DUF4367 domain-containing protein [Peptococcaceae bacterium]
GDSAAPPAPATPASAPEAAREQAGPAAKPPAQSPPLAGGMPAPSPEAGGGGENGDAGAGLFGGAAKPDDAGQSAAPAPTAKPAGKVPALDRAAEPGAGGKGGAESLRVMAGEAQGLGVSGGLALRQGTLEQAVKETGIAPRLPSYLPEGAAPAGAAWREGAVFVRYRVGTSTITVGQGREPAYRLPAGEGAGRPVEVNGIKGVLAESSSGGGAAVSWEKDGWTFSVEGGISPEELVKIASSIN